MPCPTAWRDRQKYVPTWSQLRPDVATSTSRCSSGCVATYFQLHRQLADEQYPSSTKSDKVTRHSSLFVFFSFSKSRLISLKNKRLHKNTYINSPKLLNADFSLRTQPRLFFAGQFTGVEGYVESAASGLMAGIHAARRVLGQPTVDFPPETAHGALAHYISSPEIKNFQPMNVNFGLIPPLGKRVRGKKIKNAMIAERALEALAEVHNSVFKEFL